MSIIGLRGEECLDITRGPCRGLSANRRVFTFPSLFLTILFVASGCAHVQPPSGLSEESTPTSLTQVLQQNKPPLPRAEPQEISIRGMALKNTTFDIPVTINSSVEKWIDYFCNRGRPFFQKYLDRSNLFIPYIVPLLRENGLPEDLVYLAMIESGFNNLARSRARAVGPWQFISATGKRYGLRVNWWVDERRDIKKSTLAAVEYLRDLYTMFQSWELAAASYNAGEAKIARAIRRYGTKDFWVIARHQYLRKETRNYVPKIIAAAIISKNRAQFGFEENNIIPETDDESSGIAAGQLAKVDPLGSPDAEEDSDKESEGDAINVAEDVTGREGDPLTEKSHELVAFKKEAPPLKPVRTIQTPHVTRKGELGGEDLMDFEIQSPADLLKIARASGLSYLTVKSLNPEVLRWCTPPTLGTYRIKLPVSVKDRFLATYNHEAFPRQVKFMTYKVRPGETLARIARHFGIKVDPISDLNRIHPKTLLTKGTRVLLPIPNDRSRNFASLDVRDPPDRSRRRSHRRSARHKRNYFNVTRGDSSSPVPRNRVDKG